MSRPDLLDGSSTTTNFNGETSTYPSISTRMDPFSTAAERCVAGILDRFVPLARGTPTIDPDQPHPHLLAYRGYVPAPGWPRAYCFEAGEWVDTENGKVWSP